MRGQFLDKVQRGVPVVYAPLAEDQVDLTPERTVAGAQPRSDSCIARSETGQGRRTF